MKRHFFCVTSFLCLSGNLFSLPNEHSTVAGDVKVHQVDSKTMKIEASHRSIVEYKDFNIKKGEKLQFVQPSSSSTVLNRVVGKNPSKIFGSLESNGKVFLVNQRGVYFGPNAVVKAGSFVASTLEIANNDFLKDRFHFVLERKNALVEIRNEGFLSSSLEGSIVLMAPIIQNLGHIQVGAGKVVLAAGENVTLDFHGDRLLQFSVQGSIKDAVIEHLGVIHAENGEVSMKLPVAKKAIRDIVNHEGRERGEVFVEENGEIFLRPASSIIAKKVSVEGANVQIDGKVDASTQEGQGGHVLITGTNISLKGAAIDASGSHGGGIVLVGGEYQGSGSTPYASQVSMDNSSSIVANAIENGSGGLVVLWSQDKTEFEGKIAARGGAYKGDGGSVETSSVNALQVFAGSVDTGASSGKKGDWLLDPSHLFIVPGSSTAYSGCSGGIVGVDSFTSSISNVTLCATNIYQETPIIMTELETGLHFQAPPNEFGSLYLGHDIVTENGLIRVSNMNTYLTGDVSIDTAGGASLGADAIFGSVDSLDGNWHFIVQAGIHGNVLLADVGATTPMSSITINAQNALVQNLYTSNGSIVISAPVYFRTDALVMTDGGSIAMPNINGISAGEQNLIISTGTGRIEIESIGVSYPFTSFSITSGADDIHIGNVLTYGGAVTIVPRIELIDSLKIKTFSNLDTYLSGPIFLGEIVTALPGRQSLTLEAGLKGDITVGNVGTSALPLKDVTLLGSQEIMTQNIYGDSLFIKGASSGRVTLQGDTVLTGAEGLIIESGPVTVGGSITADFLRIQSQGSILNGTATQYPITVLNNGRVHMEVSHVQGSIGTADSPIILNAEGPITLGGTSIHVEGTHSTISYIKDNKPNFILFNGRLYEGRRGAREIFQTLPNHVRSRPVVVGTNPILIGTDPSVFQYNGVQRSQFAPLKLNLDDLDSFSKKSL